MITIETIVIILFAIFLDFLKVIKKSFIFIKNYKWKRVILKQYYILLVQHLF